MELVSTSRRALTRVAKSSTGVGSSGAKVTSAASPNQVSAEVTDDVFVRSVYFWDPDGVMLEFASWTHKGFTEQDVAHEAVDDKGRKSRPVVLKPAFETAS